MHVGTNNKNFNYNIGGIKIKAVEKEKDLGVIIDKGFTFTEHIAAVVKKANQMLGIIKRKVKNKTKDIIVRLYKALVRPHLEYCIQLWNPSLKCNIKLVESVQRCALKLINGYKNYSYGERLVRCGLISLEKRCVKGDLIEMFKMSKNNDLFNSMFKLRRSESLRGNKLTVLNTICKLNIRKYFFNHRIVDVWNKLPDSVILSNSLNSFQNNLDKIDYCADNYVS